METLVVVGGVAAGLSAASAAKRLKKKALRTIVFEKSGYISYGACSEPYFVAGLVPEPEGLIEITPEEFARKREIPTHRLHEVVEVDYERGQVTVHDLASDRRFNEHFDYLMLATGSLARGLGVPGEHLTGVHTLRTVEDAVTIRNSARAATDVVICGGGYIGLEMAEAFVAMGKHVTVLKKTPHMLLNFDPEISALVEEEVRAKGVDVRTGVDVIACEGRGRVEKVLTSEGAFKAETVLVAKGAVPNTALAQQMGVNVGRTGAIAVTKRQQTNLERVYAGGDCAEAHHLVSDKPAYIPLGTTANKAGRVAGENIGGLRTEFPGIVGTAVAKIFDLEVARTGLSFEEATANGLATRATTIQQRSRSRHYPGGSPITVHLLTEQDTHRLLGAQMIGKEGVAQRIDVFAAALHAGMTAEDLYHLDLAYAPPYAPVWDPILVAANTARKAEERV
jgi:NADPH-dependent 2,4-dienoyl-CoA reductase/sulfur reductase-like enzyme